MGKRKRNSIDRISQLPQPIQHNILNFLKNKEIAQLATLSKAWRGIVESRPVLRFKQWDFRGSSQSKDRFFVKHIHSSIRKLVKQNLGVQEFNLEVYRYEPLHFYSHLHRWIKKLVKVAKVKVLCLRLGPRYYPDSYDYMLPRLVFLSETITDLRLSHCKLEQCSNVRMPNLRQLSLDEVTLRHDTIKKISSGCPSLEVLELRCCKGLSEVKISSGCPSLEVLGLNLCKGLSEVKIVAPRLQDFKVSTHDDDYDICNPKINLLACESTLRRLTLSGVSVTNEGLKNLVSKFHGLEELGLSHLDVESIEIPNQKLYELRLWGCYNLERLKIDSPNLRVLVFNCNKLPVYSVNSSFPLNDAIDFCVHFSMYFGVGSTSPLCLDNFKKLFVMFSRCTDIKLIATYHDDNLIVYEDLNESFIDMLSDMNGEWSISFKIMRITSYEDMANRLLGHYVAPNTLNIVSCYWRNNKKLLEILSKKSYKRTRRHLCDAKIVTGGIGMDPDWFKSFDTVKYEITRIELCWKRN